jgi:hypothetical protein
MWNCPNCGEQIDDAFDACWKCGTAQDGTRAADFQPEPGDPETHDPRADPDPPDEQVADDPRNDRIVELCEAANAFEAHALCGLLEEAGVRCRIVGETLGNAAGGLPLGETIAPRIWVREEDAARAWQIIDEQTGETGQQWIWPAEPAEPDAAPDEDHAPRVPGAGSHRRGRVLLFTGLAFVVLGIALALNDWIIVHKYAGTAEGVVVQCETHHSVDPRPTSDLPVPRLSPTLSVWYEVQYAFVVNSETYYSVVPHCQRFAWRISIHYDPRDPAANIRGPLTSPWPVLAVALAIGGGLSLAGYRRARMGRREQLQE